MKRIHESKIVPTKIEGKTGSVSAHDILDENIQAGVRIIQTHSDVPKPVHKHAERQVLYVIEGTGEITNGKETLKIIPGDFVILEANEEHYVRTTEHEMKVFEIKFP